MKDFNALVRDSLPSKNLPGTWQWGKNMLLSKGYKSIANEDGFKFEYLIEGTVIGVIATTEDIIYFSKNEDGTDEVGIITDEVSPVYTTIIKSSLFNFQYNCPIEGVFIYNYNKELIVAWCDGVKGNSNTPKVLNVTNPPLFLNGDKTLVDNKEFDKINMFPNIKDANIDVTYLESGAIDANIAYITYAYVFDDGTPTQYFSINTLAYLGVGVNPVKQQGIRLNFIGLDTNFTKIKIGLVVKKEGTLFGYESYSINYEGDTTEVDIVGLGNYTSTSAENIVLTKATFDKIGTMTKQEDQLELGNLVTKDRIGFQKYANMLELKPVRIHTTEDRQLPSLLPDEVYSIYMELEHLDGTWSEAFHIPGRVAEGTEREDLTTQQIADNHLDWAITNEVGFKQFHFYNNGVISTSGNKMGYWENKETYPNDDHYNSTLDYSGQSLNGSDLRGTPIRYHRMPSIRTLYEEGLINNTTDGIVRLGVQVTNIDSLVPQTILDKIQGYRLSFVKRTSGNSYVAGNYVQSRKGVIGESFDDVQYSWEFADFRKNDTNREDANSPVDFTDGRLFGTELYKYKPSLNLTYIRANYLSPSSAYLGANQTLINVENKYQFGKVRSPITYIKGNNSVASTEFIDEGINLDIQYDDQLGGVDSTKYIILPTSLSGYEYYVLNCTAFHHKVNVYPGFKSTNLVVLGKTRRFTDLTGFSGGDVFTSSTIISVLFGAERSSLVGHEQIVQSIDYLSIWGLYSPTNNATLTKVYEINSFPVLSQLVLLDESNPDNIDTLKLNDREYIFNVEGSDDFSEILDINTILTFDHASKYTNRLPYRIQRGIKIGNESLETTSLRSFLTEDYYEMPNDKGEIIALRGSETTLYIQHRFALFVASIKDTLQTPSGESAYLGRGDLFDRPPSEILSESKGYIGSSSKFACGVIKGMYIVVNQITGQIFIIKQGVKEISNQGNTNWFRNNWDTGLDFFELDINNEKVRIDNPYVSVGHLIGYDKEYSRLLFTKKAYKFIGDMTDVTFDGEFYTKDGNKLEYTDTNYFANISRTISYSLLGEGGWLFEHDYYPNLMFHTFSALYSTTNALNGSARCNIYKHNDKLSKGLYYGQKFDSYVDLIFNQNLDTSKLYQSINWITDVIENSGGNNRFKTITHIAIYNNNQCSGIINLKDNHFALTRNVQDEWNFNDFRDLVINPSNPILDEKGDIIESNLNNVKLWFDNSNFISKFIVVRLIVDNLLNDSVYIHEVKVKSLISKR